MLQRTIIKKLKLSIIITIIIGYTYINNVKEGLSVERQNIHLKEIEEKYQLFEIPQHLTPPYDNTHDFAKNFEKCSILKNYATTYSASTNSNQDK